MTVPAHLRAPNKEDASRAPIARLRGGAAARRTRWWPMAALMLSLAWAGGSAASRGPFHANTFGGDIELDRAPEGASVTTFGGNIHLRSAARRVRATTFGGDVRLDAVEGSVHVTSFGGNVRVALVRAPAEGDRDVTLRTFGGDVSLAFPAGFSAAIDVELVCGRYGEGSHRIESDFPLEQTIGPWRRSFFLLGSSRRTIHAWGRLGRGDIPIHIRAYGGNVTLTRETGARAAR